MPAGRSSRYAAATLMLGMLVPLAMAQDLDPVKQREEQKKIKSRIDEAARRLGSTIDAMAYQRLSPSAERKMLEGVAGDLRGLSAEQVRDILNRLDAAITAPDPATATAAQKEAFAKQRQVIEQLRGMFFKLDVIKNLDEAAARLEHAADTQVDIRATTITNAKLPLRPGRRGPVLDDSETIAIEQSDLRAEVEAVFKQVRILATDPEISKVLTAEQKDRLAAADVLARGDALVAEIKETIDSIRRRLFDDASAQQLRHAKELKELAAALRTPPGNRLDALKAAAEKLDRAVDAQTKVNNDAKEPVKPAEADKAARAGLDPKMVKGNELANQQTKAEFAARDARRAAQQAAPEVADLITPAENKQWKAEDALRKGDIEKAQEPQENALNELKAAKNELDRQIAAAELAKKDPLAAVKQAAERVEQLIKDQKDAGAKAQKAEANPAKLPDAKLAQKDVAKGTDEVRNSPLPPNNEAKNALDKAAQAMKAANDKLDKSNPSSARPDQQQALKNLEDAKKALDEQAKAIEQRREDIAKLEELKNKLEELAKNEKQVEKDANKAAADPKKPDTGDIAKKQGDLTEPTKDAGQQLKDLANQTKNADPKAANDLNKAADKVGDANKQQEGAKSDLSMNMPMAGGEKAKDAADKLTDAAKDVQKQLDQKKGQEARDQAALQPNKVDPNNAAQQVQKAIDEANMAAQKSNEANMAQQPMDGMMGKDLTQLQKDIAKQAADQKLPDAAKAADMAAQALEKGDIPQALQNQQKALQELNKATQQPMGMQPGDKGMQPGDKGMPPGDKGMQPGDKGMQPGDKGMGMQPGDKGMGMGMQPGMGQTPGQLAKQQQQVLDATKALQQSQQSTNAAQAALQQAQANAPMAVQGQLQQAQNQLQQAQNQLQQGQPGQAGMNQQGAAQNLQQALDALNAAQQPGMGMGMGMGMAQGMGMGMGQGMGMGMAQGMGQGMGMGMGMGQQPGMGMAQGMGPGTQGMNPGTSEGDMNGTDKLKNANSSGTAATGDGTFINLRKKEREKVQQGSDAQFPAEFRELIKQYNVNIKNAKPSTAPGPGK